MKEKYVWLFFTVSLLCYVIAGVFFLLYLADPKHMSDPIGGYICNIACNSTEQKILIPCPGQDYCISFDTLLCSQVMIPVTAAGLFGFIASILAIILLIDDPHVVGNWKLLSLLLILIFGFFGVWIYLRGRKMLKLKFGEDKYA